jgi:hypothetical protein
MRQDSGFPKALTKWIGTDAELLRSLVALRRLGAEGVDALDAVLAVRRVAALRASWNLWAAMVEGGGGDPEVLLLAELPLYVLDHARLALWGPSWREDNLIPEASIAPLGARHG